MQAEIVTKNVSTNCQVELVCASDLMSDVLAFSRPGSVLLTSLVSPQAIRTAEIADISAICFVSGKKPSPDVITAAEECGIPVMVCNYSLYTCSGKLFEIGLLGCQEVHG